MSKKTEVLIDGLTFTEGPRWHDERLYFSDFFTHRVLAVDIEGAFRNHRRDSLSTFRIRVAAGWIHAYCPQ